MRSTLVFSDHDQLGSDINAKAEGSSRNRRRDDLIEEVGRPVFESDLSAVGRSSYGNNKGSFFLWPRLDLIEVLNEALRTFLVLARVASADD